MLVRRASMESTKVHSTTVKRTPKIPPTTMKRSTTMKRTGKVPTTHVKRSTTGRCTGNVHPTAMGHITRHVRQARHTASATHVPLTMGATEGVRVGGGGGRGHTGGATVMCIL